ncbi:hypothetical protein WA158_006678 [Blastocystis sp. Blastoise]
MSKDTLDGYIDILKQKTNENKIAGLMLIDEKGNPNVLSSDQSLLIYEALSTKFIKKLLKIKDGATDLSELCENKEVCNELQEVYDSLIYLFPLLKSYESKNHLLFIISHLKMDICDMKSEYIVLLLDTISSSCDELSLLETDEEQLYIEQAKLDIKRKKEKEEEKKKQYKKAENEYNDKEPENSDTIKTNLTKETFMAYMKEQQEIYNKKMNEQKEKKTIKGFSLNDDDDDDEEEDNNNKDDINRFQLPSEKLTLKKDIENYIIHIYDYLTQLVISTSNSSLNPINLIILDSLTKYLQKTKGQLQYYFLQLIYNIIDHDLILQGKGRESWLIRLKQFFYRILRSQIPTNLTILSYEVINILIDKYQYHWLFEIIRDEKTYGTFLTLIISVASIELCLNIMIYIITELGNSVESESKNEFSKLSENKLMSIALLYKDTITSVCLCLQQIFMLMDNDIYKNEYSTNSYFIYIYPIIVICCHYISCCLREIPDDVEEVENGVLDQMEIWHNLYDIQNINN